MVGVVVAAVVGAAVVGALYAEVVEVEVLLVEDVEVALPAVATVGSGSDLGAILGWTTKKPPTPWPSTSPGLASEANRYRGTSWYVTCKRPWASRTAPSPVTPFPGIAAVTPFGNVSGGQATAHSPVQVGWSGLSAESL
ncbi:MAG TPA: hypothetical protein VED59_06365 [Acidimicrobiales bacterium]|nr:hypothetical protein [Acidimicrobiales bacterium]